MLSRQERLRADRRAVQEATNAYAVIDKGNRPLVHLRSGFIHLSVAREAGGVPGHTDDAFESDTSTVSIKARLRRDWSTRPPLTYIVHRRTRALQLYLTIVYMAHCEQAPGHAVRNLRGISHRMPTASGTWTVLSGLGGHGASRARRARITRALDELERAQLVRLGEGRARYEGFQLLQDDGSQRVYTVPGDEAENVIPVPASFFLNGWHLVLEPREVVMFLAILHAQQLHLPRRRRAQFRGVAIPEKLRDTRYGISGEVYDSVHQLKAFGLINIIDIMPNRSGGKVPPTREYIQWRGEVDVIEVPPSPVPYEFLANLDALGRDAIGVVEECLTRRVASGEPARH